MPIGYPFILSLGWGETFLPGLEKLFPAPYESVSFFPIDSLPLLLPEDFLGILVLRVYIVFEHRSWFVENR